MFSLKYQQEPSKRKKVEKKSICVLTKGSDYDIIIK